MSTAFPRTAAYQKPKHGSRSTGVKCTLLSPCFLATTIRELNSLPRRDASESPFYLWCMQNAAALIGNCCRIDVFQSHSDRFLKALEICQKSARKDIKDLDLGKSFSWGDVMAEYGHACQIYNAKAKGLRGLPRKWGRITGDIAPSVIPLLSFIPDGQYKPLFAGLVLIFRVSIDSIGRNCASL